MVSIQRLPRRVGVVCGGSSKEAEVSRRSAAAVADALRHSVEHVELFELDAKLAGALVEARIEAVFPVAHGSPGEDGTLQGLLEILGLPYVGSGVLASACAIDKVVAKRLFRSFGLPVANDVVVTAQQGLEAAVQAIQEALPTPLVLKPARQGSALGVHFVDDPSQLPAALAATLALDDVVLAEARIFGREITVGVLEGDGVEALPVCEIRTPTDTWYDFEHRYRVGGSEHVIPAPLPASQYQRLQQVACQAHQALQCRDLSRADFVVPEGGEPVLLEVNTIPGMTATSLYPDEARAAGMSFEALVAHLIERAWGRRIEALQR